MRKTSRMVLIGLAVLLSMAAIQSQALASDEFLMNGEAIVSELPVTIEAGWLEEDMNAQPSDDACTAKFAADIATGGKLLLLLSVEPGPLVCTNKGGRCLDATSETLTPLNMPWNVNLELMGSGEFLAVFSDETGKEIRWRKECQTGIGLITDECDWDTNALLENVPEGYVLGIFNSESKGVTCTIGAAEETLLEGSFLIVKAGKSISVS